MRNARNTRKPIMCFRCGSEKHFIANFPKPDTSDKKVHWNMEKPKSCVYRLTKIYKTLEKSTGESQSQKTYVSMTRMSTNAESTRRNYGDSLELTNWILDSGTTCCMTPDISDFIPGSLVETDKYIKLQMGISSQEKKQEKFK